MVAPHGGTPAKMPFEVITDMLASIRKHTQRQEEHLTTLAGGLGILRTLFNGDTPAWSVPFGVWQEACCSAQAWCSGGPNPQRPITPRFSQWILSWSSSGLPSPKGIQDKLEAAYRSGKVQPPVGRK